ncbi:universal stress protein [Gordonia spumicola]|uniref:Universal stress protein n=1 Tax=Gordonia spumicola TaxID=589161 RepID=A0A7I9V7A6_9ACTN|nr:universal stress protein [Gordonia spumicola]GEE00963.1 universal stress protein [Gordonia spumicola]
MSMILVGVDGSEASTDAVTWAARAAAVEHLPLKIVAAYTSTTSDYAPGLVIPQDVIDAIRTEATKAVQTAAETARAEVPGIDLSGSIVEGDAARVVLELGAQAQTIVLGTRGFGSVKGLFLGSVSTNVAAHAKGRVVIVPHGALGGDGPVVVGVDDSAISDPAVAEAYRQADLRSRPLVAVHTWTPLDADALHGFGLDEAEIDEMSRQAVEAVAERMAGYGQDYPDVDVQRVVIPEEPAKAILDASGEAASLIVMGSRGRGGFTGLLLGSRSQKVLHHAKVPVMIVRK